MAQPTAHNSKSDQFGGVYVCFAAYRTAVAEDRSGSKLPVRATAAFRRMACRRFCGRQESLFDGTGGGSWRDGNSIELEDPAP